MATEDFFDGVESSVINALSKSDEKGIRGGSVAQGEHLEKFQDRKRDIAERLDGGGIDRSSDWASPLHGEGGGDFLLGGEAQFFDPFADFSVTGATLSFEGGGDLDVGKLAASHHEEAEGNAVRRLRRWGHDAEAGELIDQSDLQTLGLAIECALQHGSGGPMAVAEPLPV
jgi:hypothetical protein